MAQFSIRPLKSGLGARVEGLALEDAANDAAVFADLRAAFDAHSLLILSGQNLDEPTHMALNARFGPIEDRPKMAGEDTPFEVPKVSNQTADGGVTAEFDDHTLNLKANMLWHTDSTFLPVPALVNVLSAKVVPSRGGETQIANTAAAFAAMAPDTQARLRSTVFWHRLSHSRARISAALAQKPQFNRFPDRPWRGVWTNPATGRESVYVASHAFAVEGMTPRDGLAFIDEVVAFCTQDRFVYSHGWSVGDVLIFDERATLHRGQPWPYDEPRTLQSICSTATVSDGLDSVRVLRA